MDNTIIGAIIGASSAIIINGLIFILSRSNERKKEKIQLISEIISNLNSQIRYSKRFIGHQIWLNYYHRTLPLTLKSEFHTIANNKIEFRIKQIEDIEHRFIESDSQLSTLTSKFRSIFPKDKYFTNAIQEIVEYIIADHVSIESFKNWDDKIFNDKQISSKVKYEEKKALINLESTFIPLVSKLINHLEEKI